MGIVYNTNKINNNDNKMPILDKTLLDLALREDLGYPPADITTQTLFAASDPLGQAIIRSKHATPVTVCGLAIINSIYQQLTSSAVIETSCTDGDTIAPHEALCTITAPASILLMGERLTLNFLRHLSAIATLTASYVAKIIDTQTKILDTRKTTPGLRQLEKYAVHCGGGTNHRQGLYDAYMIKDTHVDLIGSMQAALERMPQKQNHSRPVIVEVRNLTELDMVLTHGLDKVTRVLLDNMEPATLATCVQACERRVETEASGNISLATIADVASTGVGYASIGRLTYDAGHVDLSMQIDLPS